MIVRAADLFCGAGGTSTGLANAAERSGVSLQLTAVNHWTTAVDTHSKNHPGARHLCAALDSLNPRELFQEGELNILWASPECTHHSVARGGKPINDQSRATAWCVIRWAEALRPDVILVENVKEFMSWGPIGTNGKPLKRKKGDIFKAWVKSLESVGYRVEHRVLCAADYGDPTTRRRLFIYAVRGSARIEWPTPSHSPKGENGLLSWIPAREIIDWADKGNSVFTRKKPLAEKTMRRIMIGLDRFGLAPFIVPQNRGGRPVHPTSDPLATLTTTSRGVGLAQPFLVQLRGTATAKSLNDPTPAVTAGGTHLGLAEPFIIAIDHQGGGSNSYVGSVDEPLSTATTKQRHAVCEPFIVRYNGERGEQEARVHTPDLPLPTLDTSNRFAVAQPYLVKYYGTGEAKPITAPLDAVTTKPRYGLCQPVIEINGEKFIVDILFRMLRPKELAKAQGFPDLYQFAGNTTDIVKQIGNAVPTNLAQALGKSAIAHLKRK